MSWSNQTKHIEWHQNCKCKCRLNKDGMKINADMNVNIS